MIEPSDQYLVVVNEHDLKVAGKMFIRWKAVRNELYAQLEQRIWDKGKVKTKVVVYLGKKPFEKLLQMLREGKITVNEVAQIRYREKPVGFQNIMVYALVMECRGKVDPFVKTVFKKNFRTKHVFVYEHMTDMKEFV